MPRRKKLEADEALKAWSRVRDWRVATKKTLESIEALAARTNVALPERYLIRKTLKRLFERERVLTLRRMGQAARRSTREAILSVLEDLEAAGAVAREGRVNRMGRAVTEWRLLDGKRFLPKTTETARLLLEAVERELGLSIDDEGTVRIMGEVFETNMRPLLLSTSDGF